MNFVKEEKNGEAMASIDGALTINEVADLGKNLLASIEANTSLSLDLSQVMDCDTAGIQLLLSAKKTAENLKKTFSVIYTSQSVLSTARQIGIEFHEIE